MWMYSILLKIYQMKPLWFALQLNVLSNKNAPNSPRWTNGAMFLLSGYCEHLNGSVWSNNRRDDLVNRWHVREKRQTHSSLHFWGACWCGLMTTIPSGVKMIKYNQKGVFKWPVFTGHLKTHRGHQHNHQPSDKPIVSCTIPLSLWNLPILLSWGDRLKAKRFPGGEDGISES